MNGTFSRLGTLALVVVMVGLLVGCNTKRLKDERDALFIQNQELQDRLTQTQAAHDAAVSDRERLAAEAARLQAEAAAAREAAARAAASRQQQSAGRTASTGRGASSFGQIPDVESFERNGLLTVRVAGDVLFSSGQADLKASSRQTLTKIVNVLKSEYPNNTITINGYTDSDPIRKSKWKSNDELSLARANAVRTFLRQQGIAAGRLQAVGHGSKNPRPTKAQSRRVEIVVVLDN
jgi:flagellar motor protein MotB